MYELITVAFSHFCEKARWVLDRNRVPYREHRYMPMFHFPAAIRANLSAGAGRADRASTRFSTPILHGDGVHLADSSAIVRHIEPALFDHPEAAELDQRFGEELGPHSRRVGYWFCLGDPELIFGLADRNVGVLQARFFRATFPLGRRFLARRLAVDESGYLRSAERTRRIADEVGERLSDGRRYLCGDEFSAADLSFAALFAPGILPGPEDFGAALPAFEALPEDAQRLITELREHPAGVFAKRMFREERWPKA